MVKISILQIKLVHTFVFWILSVCVLYALFSGIADRVTTWTWVAVGLPEEPRRQMSVLDW